MNGVELSEQALTLRPELKVLCASGFDVHSVAYGETSAAAIRTISKPYTADELAAHIAEILGTVPASATATRGAPRAA